MNYQSGNLKITTPYEIRMIRDDEFGDVDLYVDTRGYTLNLDMNFESKGIVSRIQFPGTRAVLIRYNKHEDTMATVIMLKNVDIQSQISNFEIDYGKFEVELEEHNHQIDFKLVQK